MITDVIFYASLVYLVVWVTWRILISRRKGTEGVGKKESDLAGRIFGRGWVHPAVALALIIITFAIRSELGPFSRWNDQERAELSHLVEALTYYDDATNLYSSKDELSAEDWESVNALLETALAEGEQVKPELLQKVHPELNQKFQELFLPGLRTGTFGLRNFTSPSRKGRDTAVDKIGADSLQAGRQLLSEWNEWFRVNRAQILDKID